jgi:hypothetical protein
MILRLFVFLFALAGAPAIAGEVRSAGPDEALSGTSDGSYIDLVRLVVPDIALKDGLYKGGMPIEMRHVGGDPAERPEETTLRDLSALDVNSDGKPRLALLFDLGETPGAVESFTVLALYDVSAEPKLLDAVAVGFDRFTGLYEQGRMPVSARNDVILTASTHFNSSQGYRITAMILARGDRFELVHSLFTLDEKGCGYERRQVPAYDARPGAALFADIEVAVSDVIALTGGDCGDEPAPEPLSRVVRMIYRWHMSEKKYVPDGDALEKLEAENMERL